ncbi:MAG: hypothetical protein Fur0020_11570 [Thermodesulfovibrionia bacterium]
MTDAHIHTHAHTHTHHRSLITIKDAGNSWSGLETMVNGIIRTALFIIASISFIILSWLILIPDELIRSRIEGAFNNKGFNITINGIRKTPLFGIKADSLIIWIDKKEVIRITEPSAVFNPLYLFKEGLMLPIKGRIRDGEVHGGLNPPNALSLNIIRVSLDSISYLKDIGFRGDGHISGKINLMDGVMDIRFEMPDLNIISTGVFPFPFAHTFHSLHGAIKIDGSNIIIESIGLDGEKGYARVKGNIRGDDIRLSLEFMPNYDRLTPIELMLINKYQVSPGYYVIPINNLLPAS